MAEADLIDVRLEVEVPESGAEAAAELLRQISSEGVERIDAETLAPLGEAVPGPGRVRLRVYLPSPAQDAVSEIASELKAAQEAGAEVAPFCVRAVELPRSQWQERWKEYFHPVRISARLWVRPPWEQLVDAGKGEVCVIIDPGAAFGTGGHETTRLCLEAIDDVVAGEARARAEGGRAVSVFDVGCGSGVLAIAATLLGCRRVLAVDVDPDAITATRENAERNGVQVEVRLGGPDATDDLFDLVVANVTSPVLVSLRDSLVQRVAPGGWLVLSGILADERAGVAEAFGAAGAVTLHSEKVLGEWSRLVLRRQEA